MNNKKTAASIKKITFMGIFVSLALILSYVEALIPINFGIPGVKLGLANLVVVFCMYTRDNTSAFIINIIRIIISGLLFSPGIMILYSICGALMSFLGMILAKEVFHFGTVGVSVLGGVAHNIGQLAVAAVVMETMSIAYYLPVLLIAGTLTGSLIGICVTYLIKLLPKEFKK